MSLSLGGWGLVSLRNPFTDLLSMISGRGDLRSFLCFIVFCIVSLVLAYLTNPSENSFRAYLTEQSFRHHLSRLDDRSDDVSYPDVLRQPLHKSHPPSFHFSTRASVSLRTPKHVFHSFAIFTIAAMVPLSKPNSAANGDGWAISDSWYIGAFGKWWRGGVLEAWYQDIITRNKDEESWTAGILNIKRLDALHKYTSTFTDQRLPLPSSFRRVTPTLSAREFQGNGRSESPPPLPKSASLPIHVPKTTTVIDSPVQGPTPVSASALQDELCTPSVKCAPPPEITPLLGETLRQVTEAKVAVQELKTQLAACESASARSRETLQHELDHQRTCKKQDDASRSELRSRIKTLDDSKRAVEGLKRDAQKKLKAAQTLQKETSDRIQHLDRRIDDLRQRLQADREFLVEHQDDPISETERSLSQLLQEKRDEIKEGEEAFMDCTQRARSLEEKLEAQRSRLQAHQHKAAVDEQTSEESYALRQANGPLDVDLFGSYPSSLPFGLQYPVHGHEYHGHQYPDSPIDHDYFLLNNGNFGKPPPHDLHDDPTLPFADPYARMSAPRSVVALPLLPMGLDPHPTTIPDSHWPIGPVSPSANRAKQVDHRITTTIPPIPALSSSLAPGLTLPTADSPISQTCSSMSGVFAPSAEERQALEYAWRNARYRSFDQSPSLASDPRVESYIRTSFTRLPSSNGKKLTFSPWADEEPVLSATSPSSV